jgi:acetoin utilization deacetylase AcuC-like enzyme
MAGGYSDEYAFEIAAPQITPARRPPPAAATLPPPAALPAAGPPPPCAPLASLGLLYIKSHRLARLALRAPVNRDRAALVPALLAAAGLLDGPGVAVEEARPASVEELRQYHSADYLAALVSPHPAEGRRPAALHRFGLADDCAPWPGVYDHAALCAGGSLQAAAALCARRCRAAVHLDGGRHHARRGAAAGYCYLNDCVLAVLRLLESFPRVLYVDVDAHHGDAVEEAFLATDR